MDGQMSLFDGFLTEVCDTKPEIGRELECLIDGIHPCVVDAHCGYDFFHVRFMDEESEGWHLSLRGYGKSWRYK